MSKWTFHRTPTYHIHTYLNRRSRKLRNYYKNKPYVQSSYIDEDGNLIVKINNYLYATRKKEFKITEGIILTFNEANLIDRKKGEDEKKVVEIRNKDRFSYINHYTNESHLVFLDDIDWSTFKKVRGSALEKLTAFQKVRLYDYDNVDNIEEDDDDSIEGDWRAAAGGRKSRRRRKTTSRNKCRKCLGKTSILT